MKDSVLGKTQIAMGALGIFAAYLLTISTAASATAIGLVLVVLLIAIAFWIEWLKDGRLKEWLSRTLWGENPEYGSEQEETTQYNLAVS